MNAMEWIDAYLEGSLDEEAQAKLQERLKTDKDFYQEFITTVATREALREEKKAAMKARHLQKTKKIRWLQVAAAASIIGLFILFGLLMRSSSPTNMQELYAQYQAPNTISLTEKNGSDSLSHQAETTFNAARYNEALSTLKELVAANPNDGYLLLLLATSQRLVNGQENQAITTLQALIDQRPTFRQAAQWELALTYLKLKNKAAALDVLEEILGEEGHDYKRKARELKRDLSALGK